MAKKPKRSRKVENVVIQSDAPKDWRQLVRHHVPLGPHPGPTRVGFENYIPTRIDRRNARPPLV